VTSAGLDIVQPPVREVEQLVTPDEEWGTGGADRRIHVPGV